MKKLITITIFVILISTVYSLYAVPVSDGFDYPVGYPDGDGYNTTAGWGWLELTDEEVYHPANDFNGNGGSDTDLGDPVYAASHGTVVELGNYGTGWGNIILVEHLLPDGTQIWTQYAHLQDIFVSVGENVVKNQTIGTIGKGYNNEYWAHLHFEVLKVYRSPSAWVTGWTTDEINQSYYEPTAFIDKNRDLRDVPILNEPADQAEFNKGENDILFDWTDVSGASYYEIWIDNNEGFGSPAIGFNNGNNDWIAEGFTSQSSFNLTTSLQNQLDQNLYYWKVWIVNSNQVPITGDWSDVRQFTLFVPLDEPTLIEPADQAEFNKGENDILFDWTDVSGASYYEIWIDNNEGFGSPAIGFNNQNNDWIAEGFTSQSSFNLTTSLQNQFDQNLYYWKVWIVNSNQAPVTGEWSDIREFYLLDQPNAPTLIEPADQAEFNKGENDILFDWTDISGASYYEILIDNNEGFVSPAIGFNNDSGDWLADGIVTSSQFTLSIALQNQLSQNTYFWQVHALDSNQLPIYDWSAYREFDLLDILLPEIKLIASDGTVNDKFGGSVSISGDNVLIGAYWDDDNGSNSGSAYIYNYDGTSWVEQQKLTASDGDTGDRFGATVSISGDYALIGAYFDDDNGDNSGSLYVYHYNGTSWVEQQKLTPSDGYAGDYFGHFVSISGDYALIGASGDNDNGNRTGSAYIYYYNGAEWVEQQKITASDGNEWDEFGDKVSISGDFALIGANKDDDYGSCSGSAYIFHYNGTEWVEQQKLTASDSDVDDHFGNSVSISGDHALIGAWGDDDHGDWSGSAYIYNYNGAEWVEQQKLTASNGDESDRFGCSVSLLEDYILIGASWDEDNGNYSGSAYIFHYNGAEWVEQQKITASDGGVEDWFGGHVSLSGDYALVGASGDGAGSAYIYNYNDSGNTLQADFTADQTNITLGDAILFTDLSTGDPVSWAWDFENDGVIDSNVQDPIFTYPEPGVYSVSLTISNEEQRDSDTEVKMDYINVSFNLEEIKLIASDGASSDYFGGGVSISGDFALIGARYDDDNGSASGSAYIFYYNGTSCVEQQKLTASDGASNDWFGSYVSISGDFALIGAMWDDDNGDYSGSAYIFYYNGTSWVEQQKLTASDGAFNDRFGSVSISGDLALIGAYQDDDNGSDSGSAYIFYYNGTSWVEQQKLIASDGDADDRFGFGSISGDLALIGAYQDDDNGSDSGSAYIFQYNGAEWVEQQKLLASDGAADDHFGSSSVSGDYALIGASRDDDNGSNSGSAYIFHYNGTEWVEQQKITASDGDAEDCFGAPVSISGDYALIGARYGDDNGSNSGSAYIFHYNGAEWVEQQKITASDGDAEDYFGSSVSISSDYALIGSPSDNDNGSNSGSAYIYNYNDSGITLQADFTAEQTNITVGDVIQFTDLSTGEPVSWAWDFENDGVIDSGVQNPVWTYEEAGIYSVSLTISNDTDSDNILKNNYITVSEGLENLEWVKSEDNPILTVNGTGWEHYFVNNYVLDDDDEYKMYYTAMVPNYMEVGLATSSDGINWTKSTNNPVIQRDVQNWSSFRIKIGSVIKREGTYYAFYYGDDQNLNANGSIGVATSPDGINWTQYENNPIISYTEIPPGDHGILNPNVVYVNGIFKMFFCHSYYGDCYYAESDDGFNWEINNDPGIYVGTSIRHDGNQYYALRSFAEEDSVGVWTSNDGISWNQYSISSFLPYQDWQISSYDTSQGYFSLLPEIESNELKLFFSSYQGAWGYQRMGFAIAEVNFVNDLEADFIADNTSGLAPLEVNFTDLSAGNITSWEWDFQNDGVIDSSVQNPVWTYEEPGVYSVSLTVSNDVSRESSTELKENYITVLSPDPILNLPETITFNEDESTILDLEDYITYYNLEELTVNWNGNVEVLISNEGLVLDFTASLNWFGDEMIAFTVSTDSSRESVTDNLDVIVTPVNDPPILEITGSFEAEEDMLSSSYDFGTFCSQVWGENDILTLSADNSEHINVQILDLEVVFESNTPNWFGTEEITFFLNDNISERFSRETSTFSSKLINQFSTDDNDSLRDIVQQIIEVTINPVNDIPELNMPEQLFLDIAGELNIDLSDYAFDIDDDALLYSAIPGDELEVEILGNLAIISSEINWSGAENVIFYADDQQSRATVSDTVLVIREFIAYPVIEDIVDVPDDQGGKVIVSFTGSCFDTDSLIVRPGESYQVEYLFEDNWTAANSTIAYGADNYFV
ncbi:MAG: PKD domain-containing protein, partial [Candidatus Stygibacter australis]|nr:PKD domain-containing protein [Candidatus Stygibacter australis]